jgi:hypothetical protein
VPKPRRFLSAQRVGNALHVKLFARAHLDTVFGMLRQSGGHWSGIMINLFLCRLNRRKFALTYSWSERAYFSKPRDFCLALLVNLYLVPQQLLQTRTLGLASDCSHLGKHEINR